jgi:transcription antitermination factor NusG
MNNIDQMLEKIDLAKPETIDSALVESIQPTIKKGDTVAIMQDPTFPFDGLKGKVVGMRADNGYAQIEFANGMKLDCITSLLIPC